MAQKLDLSKMSGSGIVVTLFLIGVFLVKSNIDHDIGIISIRAAVLIGIVYGFLGIIGIIEKMPSKRRY